MNKEKSNFNKQDFDSIYKILVHIRILFKCVQQSTIWELSSVF